VVEEELKDEINQYIQDVRECLDRMKLKEAIIISKLEKRSLRLDLPRQLPAEPLAK
jgi:hypothetical protein